jgi:hypothetical protein
VQALTVKAQMRLQSDTWPQMAQAGRRKLKQSRLGIKRLVGTKERALLRLEHLLAMVIKATRRLELDIELEQTKGRMRSPLGQVQVQASKMSLRSRLVGRRVHNHKAQMQSRLGEGQVVRVKVLNQSPLDIIFIQIRLVLMPFL